MLRASFNVNLFKTLILFLANNIQTDAQILCTPGVTKTANNGNIYFYCYRSYFIGDVYSNNARLCSEDWVTNRAYITSSPGALLTMNSNHISFTNNGAGIIWGSSGQSRIYDNGNLYITTDDNLYITAPTQLSVTATDSYFSGNVYNYESLLASQTWVNNNFLTTSPPQLSVGKLMGNPIIA